MLDTTTIKNVLNTPLSQLGLREQEISLYSIALANGPLTVRELSLEMKLSPSNIYKLAERLEFFKIAKFSDSASYAKRLIVDPPEKIIELFNQKKTLLNQLEAQFVKILPDLNANYHQGDSPTQIRVLKGVDQYMNAIETMFNEVKDEVRFFGSIDNFVNSIGEKQYSELSKIRIEKNINLKAIMLDSELSQKLIKISKEDRNIKLIDSATASKASMQISPRKVIIWQPMTPLAVLIDDEYIVSMINNMFDLIWKSIP
jgi:sugar-specific transcriptional regulator TrmB